MLYDQYFIDDLKNRADIVRIFRASFAFVDSFCVFALVPVWVVPFDLLLFAG